MDASGKANGAPAKPAGKLAPAKSVPVTKPAAAAGSKDKPLGMNSPNLPEGLKVDQALVYCKIGTFALASCFHILSLFRSSPLLCRDQGQEGGSRKAIDWRQGSGTSGGGR